MSFSNNEYIKRKIVLLDTRNLYPYELIHTVVIVVFAQHIVAVVVRCIIPIKEDNNVNYFESDENDTKLTADMIP